jgi:hypothetical protein
LALKQICSGVKIICIGLLSVLICVRVASAKLVLQGTNTVDVGLISQYDKRKVEFLFRNKDKLLSSKAKNGDITDIFQLLRFEG